MRASTPGVRRDGIQRKPFVEDEGVAGIAGAEVAEQGFGIAGPAGDGGAKRAAKRSVMLVGRRDIAHVARAGPLTALRR